jgi:hypothetical protein
MAGKKASAPETPARVGSVLATITFHMIEMLMAIGDCNGKPTVVCMGELNRKSPLLCQSNLGTAEAVAQYLARLAASINARTGGTVCRTGEDKLQ